MAWELRIKKKLWGFTEKFNFSRAHKKSKREGGLPKKEGLDSLQI